MSKEKVIKYTVGKTRTKITNVVLKFEPDADYVEALEEAFDSNGVNSLEDVKNCLCESFLNMLPDVESMNLSDAAMDQEWDKRNNQQDFIQDNTELLLEFRNNSICLVFQGRTEGGKTKQFALFENLKNHMMAKEIKS